MFVVYEKDEKKVRFFESFWSACEYLVREVLNDLRTTDKKTLELYRGGLLELNRSMASHNIEIDWVEEGQPFCS